MNKTELIDSIAKKAELSKKDAEAALKAFTDTVSAELKNGGSAGWLWYLRGIRAGCQRRPESPQRRDHADRCLQEPQVQTRQGSEGRGQRQIIHEIR